MGIICFFGTEAQELARPSDYDYLDLLEKRFYFLRRYTPKLLNILEFKSSQANEPILKALDIIRDLNETGKRKIPSDAPIELSLSVGKDIFTMMTDP